jgi:hypothetical protein
VTEADDGLSWPELSDGERIGHAYRDWDEEVTISLNCGVSLVLNQYFDRWTVYGSGDAEPKDIIQPEQWRSARALLRHVQRFGHEEEESEQDNGPPVRWSR